MEETMRVILALAMMLLLAGAGAVSAFPQHSNAGREIHKYQWFRRSTSAFDYNNDNAVNDKDVSFILRVTVGTSSCPVGKDCDLDNDNRVSAYDASLLGQLIEKTTFDYNNDSTINNKDVEYLLGIVVGTNTCPTGKTCDINSDQRITSYDASLLMQMTSEL